VYLLAGYLEEGFLALQYAIDMSVLELSTDHSFSASNVSLSLRRFPYPPYVDDNFVLVIQQQLPFIIMLSFVFSSMQIVKDIVHEKEQKLKVNVDIMICD
jgi:ATP-binding cassette subfamily A (ABC1) protein 3